MSPSLESSPNVPCTRPNLVLLKYGEALQTHVENDCDLFFRQSVAAFDDTVLDRKTIDTRGNSTSTRKQFRHDARLPHAAHQRGAASAAPATL